MADEQCSRSTMVADPLASIRFIEKQDQRVRVQLSSNSYDGIETDSL